MKILCINSTFDHASSSVLKSLTKIGKRKKWQISTTADTQDAIELARQSQFQIIFVKIDQDRSESFSVLREIGRMKGVCPIVAILSNDCSIERARVWELGATIILSAKCSGHELEMATLAAARRSLLTTENIACVGPIELDLLREVVTVSGREVALSRMEFLIVERLILAKGSTVSRNQFINHLYDYEQCPNPKIVDVFICKIRAKFQDVAAMGNAIVTSWGVGYRLSPNIEMPLSA